MTVTIADGADGADADAAFPFQVNRHVPFAQDLPEEVFAPAPWPIAYSRPPPRSLSSRNLHRVRSVSDISGPGWPCCRKNTIRSIRAARSIASRRFNRCDAVRWRIDFANRAAASDSDERTAMRLSRSILTREVTKASRSRMAIPARVLTPFAEVDSQPIIFGARARDNGG